MIGPAPSSLQLVHGIRKKPHGKRGFFERPRPVARGMRLAFGEGVVTSPTSPEPQTVVTVRQSTDASALVNVPASGVDLEAVERALIVFALDTTNGNRTRAAKLLRLTRSALLYRLQKYGLTVKQGSS